MNALTVSDVARQLSDAHGVSIAPGVLSNLFYRRQLDVDRCPVVGQVRIIPSEYVPEIEQVLRDRKMLEQPEAEPACAT